MYSEQESLGNLGTLNQHSMEYSYSGLGTGSNNADCGPAAGTKGKTI